MMFNHCRIPSPCLDCPDRPKDRGCGEKHATCEKYIEYQQKCKAASAAERDEKRRGGSPNYNYKEDA